MFHFNRSPLFWFILGLLWALSALLMAAEHPAPLPLLLLSTLALSCFILSAIFFFLSRK